MMIGRILKVGLALGFGALVLSACGGGSTKTTTTPGKGTLFTFVGDFPACDILSYRPFVSQLTLTPQGSTNKVTVIASGSAIKVNFAALRDFSSILNLASVAEGTYDSATVTISPAQLEVFDPLISPPIEALTTTNTTTSPVASIQPPLVITKGKVSALALDLDLFHSVELDAQGQLTGKVTPIFNGEGLTASGSQGFGEMGDILGFVQRVDTSSSNPMFVGDIQVQLLSNTGPSILVNLTSSTQLFGVSALSQLPTGTFVEVSGFVDENGNVVANYIEAENREIVEQNIVAYLGIVTAATYDSGGNVTQFNLAVSETEPNIFDVPVDTQIVVNVSSSTLYQFSSRPTNFASLAFGASSVIPGLEVVVHGKFTKTTGQPTVVAADSVYLKLQSVQGTFASLVQAGSDGKTGAFTLAPCPTLLRSKGTMVFTNDKTVFLGVNGLLGLTTGPSLLIKGLPFFQLHGTTINGVTVPAGTLVILAKQVHQLS